jgi:ribose 5-phosphate isomerase
MDYLGIDEFHFRENIYTRNEKSYRVVDIIEIAKKYQSFEIPVEAIDIGVNPWGDQSIKSFCYHVRRMTDADMDEPIILDDTGYLCDGWHRLAKAIINGQKFIKAVRLTVMPESI